MPSNHLILCHPLLLLPSIFPIIRVFSNESALRIRWPNYWSFSFNISPSNEHLGLTSFRMDWLDLLAAQGTLKNLLQHHSSKASILHCSAFFINPTLTSIHDYWKNLALTRWTFVGQVLALLFNMLSRLVIAFLPRSKRLLISWLQSSSTMILEPKKIKSVTLQLFSFLFNMKWWDRMPWSSFFECWVLSQFFHSPLSLSSRGFLVLRFLPLEWYHLHWLRLLILLPAIFIPTRASSSLAFHMIYSAYKLNKQGDKIQTWRTLFPIWNQSVVPCPVLTGASWPA